MNDDLVVPVDTRPSKLATRRSGAPLNTEQGDPDDLASFDVKLQRFREANPTGVIETEIVTEYHALGGTSYLATARVWLDRNTAGKRMADVTAHASRTYGHGEEPYASRALETAESVAIGRALRFLGHGTETHERS